MNGKSKSCIAFSIIIICVLCITSVESIGKSFDIRKKGDKYGVLAVNGDVIIPYSFDVIHEVKNRGFIVGDFGFKGLYNYTGEQIFEVKYQSIDFFESTIRIKETGKFGLSTFQGKMLIECDYDSLKSTKNSNIFVLYKDEKASLVEKSVSRFEVIAEKDEIFEISQYYFRVKENGKYGIIDNSGAICLPIKYDGLQNDDNFYSFPYLSLSINEKWGVYNLFTKTWVIEPSNDNIEFHKSLSGGAFIAQKDEKFAVINREGYSTGYKYDSYDFLSEELAVFENEKGFYFPFYTDSLITSKPVLNYSVRENNFIVVKAENKVGFLKYGFMNEPVWFIADEVKTWFYSTQFECLIIVKDGNEYLAKFDGHVFEESKADDIVYLNEKFLLFKNGETAKLGFISKEPIISKKIFNSIRPLKDLGYFICDNEEYMWAEEELRSVKLRQINDGGQLITKANKGKVISNFNGNQVLLDKNNNLLLDKTCRTLNQFNYQYYQCQKKDSTYIYDSWGNIVNNLSHIFNQNVSKDFFIYNINQNYGVYNQSLKRHEITPKYSNIDFINGFYQASFGAYRSKFDIYNRSFELVGDSLESYKQHFGIFKKDGKYFLFNSHLDEFTSSITLKKPVIIGRDHFQFQIGSVNRLFDDKGIVLADEIDSIRSVSKTKHFSLYYQGGLMGLMILNNTCLPAEYKSIDYVHGNIFYVVDKYNNSYLVNAFTSSSFIKSKPVDLNFAQILKPKIKGHITNAPLQFQKSEKVGLMHNSGTEYLASIYESILLFQDNTFGFLGILESNNKKGLMNNGEVLLETIYDEIVEKVTRGYIKVKKGGEWYILDLRSNKSYQIPDQKVKITSFNTATYNNEMYLITMTGLKLL